MNVVLVDNLVFPERALVHTLDLHPHLGLVSLGAVLQQRGHHVEIVDPKRIVKTGQHPYDDRLYGVVADKLVARSPDVVGFTTLGASVLFAIRVAEEVRRRRVDLPILFGGPHATMLPQPLLERVAACDVIVRHEAEETLPEVLAALGGEGIDLASVPGVSYRAGGGIRHTPGRPRIDDLDALPLPALDLYPVESLDLELMRVEAGRGCPFSCTFCSTARFFQRRYRLKSPARLVAEMDALHARYGATDFKLDHDLFTVNKRKVRAFCDAVAGRGYRWRVSARVDCVDDALLEQMADAGCVGLYVGVETGSERMQKHVQKRLSLSLLEPMLDVATQLGIACTVSYITGYPDETREDLDATLDRLGQALQRPRASCLPQLHVLTPEPGTPMFAEHGDHLGFDDYQSPFNAHFLSLEDRHRVQADPTLFSSYHHFPSLLGRATHIFAAEAMDVLRDVEDDVAKRLVDAFGGRLSALFAAWRALAPDPSRDALRQGLIACTETALGPDASAWHARMWLAWARRDARAVGLVAGAELHPEGRWRVGPGVSVLADLDVVGAGLLPSPPAASCAVLVFPTPEGVATQVVDGGVAAILDLFRPSGVPRRVAAKLHTLIGVPAHAVDAVLRQLAAWGVLRPLEAA